MGRFINEDPIEDGLNWYAYCGNNPVKYVDPTGESFTAAFVIGCILAYTAGSIITQAAVNVTTMQPVQNNIIKAGLSGAISGLVFGITLNSGLSNLAGAATNVLCTIVAGNVTGKSSADIVSGVAEDVVGGVFAYAGDKLVGAFIKTLNINRGWIKPDSLKSFFAKSYGQKIMKQVAVNGMINATTTSMYESGVRNTTGIQQFLGISEDGIYGTATKAAVENFQKDLVKGGYMNEDDVDGWWGPITDAAFRNYIEDNVYFISE